MGLVRVISVGAAVFAVISSAAIAQQSHTGTITEVNRLNNTMAIRPTQNATVGANAQNGTAQNGTVGVNANGPSEQFKVGSGISMDAWHAGDRVSYSASGDESAKTLTKIDRARPGAQ